MGFAAGKGFQYVSGPKTFAWSDASSTASFLEGQPLVQTSVGRAVTQADSGTTLVYGVAQFNSGTSIGGYLAGKGPVLIPTPMTIFAAPIVAATAAQMAAGTIHTVEMSSGTARVTAAPSPASGQVVLVEIGTSGLAYDSTESFVHCQFLGDHIGPYGSNASARLD